LLLLLLLKWFTCVLIPLSADTGFRHVKPTEYKPRLLHFHGDRVNSLLSHSFPCRQGTLHWTPRVGLAQIITTMYSSKPGVVVCVYYVRS
jgi:hypothetical protein